MPPQVQWQGRRVDWDTAARPAWLPYSYAWGNELLGQNRSTVEYLYTKVRSALQALIEEDAAALGRGGVEAA